MTILAQGNIRLTPLLPVHEDIFIRLANMPELNERINAPSPCDPSHFHAELARLHTRPSSFTWVIEYQHELVGIINNGLWRNSHIFQGGYWVEPTYWGKGIASSALLLVKDFLFHECHAERIQALVEPDNIASIRVLEKCGYVREGLLRQFYDSKRRGLIDVVMYAAVR